jgi:NitT/TauT family transport system ATP-binding protein
MSSATERRSPVTTGDNRERLRIALRNVSKTFRFGEAELTAVESFSLDIYEGEFVCLLGPSGSGKSTVLNMTAGLLGTSGGSITVDGKAVSLNNFPDKIGYVFQRDTTYPWRTVRQNIGLGLELQGVRKDERAKRIVKAVKAARLEGFEDAFPAMLSGGMRQRVSLMRTLVMEPEILLMDEPFGALDAHTKLEMQRLLLEIWERQRQTVIFVTHDLAEALTLADRIVLLSTRPGRFKQEFCVSFPRPRDAVRLRASHEYAELFSQIWNSLGEEIEKLAPQ